MNEMQLKNNIPQTLSILVSKFVDDGVETFGEEIIEFRSLHHKYYDCGRKNNLRFGTLQLLTPFLEKRF